MEVVEEANHAAVESCKKLVAFFSLSGGDPFRPMPVAAETDEAVARFGKVVAVLSDRLGHARARVGNKRSPAPPPPIDVSCLLDHPSSLPPRHTLNSGHLISSTPAAPPPMPPATLRGVPSMRSQETEVEPPVMVSPCATVTLLAPATKKFDRNIFLETPLLELNCCSSTAMATPEKNTSIVASVPAPNPCAAAAAANIQFQPHQQQLAKKQKSFQFDQTPSGEFHIEGPVPRGGGGAKEVISFSFDNNSVCTSSAATSFFTSINSQLISMSDAATSSAATAKKTACAKRAEDGSVKCHCPKKK
nr:unnamed protein product [Digitaria exilis]